jgi:DNA-binding NarL/FixJ family response regulator
MDVRGIPAPAIDSPGLLSRRGRTASAVPANGAHLLIATTDDQLQASVRDAATLFHQTVACARSGCDAIRTAQSPSLRLLLLDQCLADVAGLEVARAVSRDIPGLPFVLIGSDLTTTITVEAMKLGAVTVLEKPLAVHEIVATLRSALVDGSGRAGFVAHTRANAPAAPRSISERWALHVYKACEAEGDLKTLGAWASFVGLSNSSLCESCRLVGIQPLVARDLARVLRAVVQSREGGCRIEELLDISDRRTLKTLMVRAGLSAASDRCRISVEQFLAAQRFVPATNAAFVVLRKLLLG